MRGKRLALLILAVTLTAAAAVLAVMQLSGKEPFGGPIAPVFLGIGGFAAVLVWAKSGKKA